MFEVLHEYLQNKYRPVHTISFPRIILLYEQQLYSQTTMFPNLLRGFISWLVAYLMLCPPSPESRACYSCMLCTNSNIQEKKKKKTLVVKIFVYSAKT